MADQNQSTIADGPNAEAIRGLADHYCIQRDPRLTSKSVGDVMAECARRLCEGHVLTGGSLEAVVYELIHDAPDMKRSDLIEMAAMLIETIALVDVTNDR